VQLVVEPEEVGEDTVESTPQQNGDDHAERQDENDQALEGRVLLDNKGCAVMQNKYTGYLMAMVVAQHVGGKQVPEPRAVVKMLCLIGNLQGLVRRFEKGIIIWIQVKKIVCSRLTLFNRSDLLIKPLGLCQYHRVLSEIPFNSLLTR